jgi:hypothetical protein
MTKGDAYRIKAAEFFAKAKADQFPDRQAEHANVAAAYLRLAEHANRNPSQDSDEGEGSAQQELKHSR